jgi:hypothetical protein
MVDLEVGSKAWSGGLRVDVSFAMRGTPNATGAEPDVMLTRRGLVP